MDDLSKQIREAMNKQPYPDSSHIKPPTEHAIYPMIRNLRAAAGTKADHSPNKAKLSERFVWREGDIKITPPNNKKPKSRNK
ncbi:MAG: hypothetical protein V4702_05380 [Patescibacteria group bacterium]